ncbi:hypothetical protein F4821DRAFT_237145 [Hypoxylon rubiginosum]|uniref:Uncharacterized protein n=1 Tax=Hypoxylon rubiginosum TaxID=110542 RepID=A0ACC0D333_9PEZI|nr:hypothetical protein F4821DRAFT_237145 [Hypoxylon rubiginosum]
MASSVSELRAAMEATLTAFLENHSVAVRTKDASVLSALLSPECTRHLHPAPYVTAYPFIKAVETNAEYEARMASELGVMEEAHLEILNIVVDPARRKASAHTEFRVKVAGREDPISSEFCWYLDFTEDGTKISRVVEFIDSATSALMIEEMMKEMHK